MSIDQAIIEQGLLAARPADGRTMEVDELHRFLLYLEAKTGARPQQVVDLPLRVRWFALDEYRRPQGDALEIELRPSEANGQLVWSVAVGSLSGEDMEEEHLEIKYLNDPEMGGDPPYLFNFRVCPADEWMHDFIIEMGQWSQVNFALPRTLAELPATLAALPPAWWDGEVLVTDEYRSLNVLANRRGMNVAVNTLGADGMVLELLQFNPVAALKAGSLIVEANRSCFSPGFEFNQNPKSGNTADPGRGILSGFGTSVEAYGPLTTPPPSEDTVDQLRALATWSQERTDDAPWNWEEFPQMP